MNLVIDIGNTRTKYAFFEGKRFVEAKYELDELFEDIGRWKKEGNSIHLLLSGSGHLPEDMRILLTELTDFCLVASPLMALPLKIGYVTPDTLGFDRIAICVGAMGKYPGCSLLVIDSGTAITFNYVSEDGEFLGGNISPGLEMRFRGLNQYTAQLPLVAPASTYGGIGRTTEEAIRNGVMNGMLFEVENYIKQFVAEYENGKVIVTGGNNRFLKDYLTFKIDFCDILGFMGLNDILLYAKKIN